MRDRDFNPHICPTSIPHAPHTLGIGRWWGVFRCRWGVMGCAVLPNPDLTVLVARGRPAAATTVYPRE